MITIIILYSGLAKLKLIRLNSLLNNFVILLIILYRLFSLLSNLFSGYVF